VTCSRPVATIRDVPILRTGIEYQLESGPRTFTVDDLQGALDALRDPHVRAPRLGIGHIDERFEPEHDGEPAFGTCTNLRLAESGNTIIADIETGPPWLTEQVVAAAFPGRSFEGQVNWTSPGGQRWPLVITAVKLLGTTWPGISTLADLERALGPEGPSLVHASWREPHRDAPAPPEEGESMTPLIERLRQLPADADDDAVMAVVREHGPAESPPAPPEGEATPPETPPEQTPAPPEQPEAQTPEPVAASAGTVTLDQESYAELRASAALGRQAHERQEREDRDVLLASAVREGRFPPSRVEHYQRLYDADSEGTQQLIASLAPGLVPVDERGGQPSTDAQAQSANAEIDWLLPPELQAKRAQAKETT